MVHTFELTKNTTVSKVIKYVKELFTVEEVKKFVLKKETLKLKNPLHFPGILSVSFSTYQEGYCLIRIVIEPASLIKAEKTIDLFACNEKNRNLLKKKLNEKLTELFKDMILSRSECWSVSRVDYTKDVYTKYVPQIINLIKKGKNPYRYREKKYKGSSYKVSKSTVVNIYDKQDHIKNNPNLYREDRGRLLEDSKNILRTEIQCRTNSKLRALKEKHNLNKKSNIYDYLQESISESLFEYHVGTILNRGDFYSQREAYKIIEKSGWGNRKKEKIKDFLKLIAQARSVTEARNQFIVGQHISNTKIFLKGSDGTFRNNIKELQSLGVNPILIPREWNISNLKNPLYE